MAEDCPAAEVDSREAGEKTTSAGQEQSVLPHCENALYDVHVFGSQVDGREDLPGGTERVVPRGCAPASALSC